MNPPARLWELTDALEFDSEELQSYFDRQTGRVVMVERSTMEALESGGDEKLADLPEWQSEEFELARAILADEGKDERFIAPPDKFEFHEYHQMERFIGTIADADIAGQLWQAIKGRGAFRCFKDTLRRLRLEDRWYRYREQAMKEFVLAWAEENDVTVADVPRTADG
jgi:hypothetical protein